MKIQIIYSQENYLHQHVTEHTRVKGAYILSILSLMCKYDTLEKENIRYDIPLGKSDHVVHDFDHVVREDMKRSERKPDSERRYSHGNCIKLSNFHGNINMEKEFHNQNEEHCFGRFCLFTAYISL